MNSSVPTTSSPRSVAPLILIDAMSTTTFVLSAVADRTSELATLNTLPEARSKFSEDSQLSPVASNLNVLLPSPDITVIPPPSAAASSAAPVPNSRFLSSTCMTVLLMVVVVPSTCKSPAITTLPVLFPTAAGSIVISAGPLIVLLVIRIADPSAPK